MVHILGITSKEMLVMIAIVMVAITIYNIITAVRASHDTTKKAVRDYSAGAAIITFVFGVVLPLGALFYKHEQISDVVRGLILLGLALVAGFNVYNAIEAAKMAHADTAKQSVYRAASLSAAIAVLLFGVVWFLFSKMKSTSVEALKKKVYEEGKEKRQREVRRAREKAEAAQRRNIARKEVQAAEEARRAAEKRKREAEWKLRAVTDESPGRTGGRTTRGRLETTRQLPSVQFAPPGAGGLQYPRFGAGAGRFGAPPAPLLPAMPAPRRPRRRSAR